MAQITEELQLAINGLAIDYHTENNAGTFRDYIFNETKGQAKLKEELGAGNLSFDTGNYQITYKGIVFDVDENGIVKATSDSEEQQAQVEDPALYIPDLDTVVPWEDLVKLGTLRDESGYVINNETYEADIEALNLSVNYTKAYVKVSDGTVTKFVWEPENYETTGYLVIDNSVTSIGDEAFRGYSGLTSITIPNSVTSIGGGAFDRCSGLTSITIPNSVTSIGEIAFADCYGLTSITIPNSVTSIGSNAFSYCYGLTSISLPNLDFIDYENNIVLKNLFSGVLTDSSYSVSVVIRGGTSIGHGAFDSCSGLTSITIPNSVTSIGERAFASCYGLTSITIPNSVTSIGVEAFRSCEGLTSITIPNSVTSIGHGAFDSCSGLTSITIPNSVTSIGNGAFDGCSGLTSISLPNLNFIDYENQQDIGRCFSPLCDSSNNVSIVLRGGTSIGEEAFYCCEGLTSITIPNSVTSIGVGAFKYCYRLTSITIPNSVTSIGHDAFSDCSGLTSITLPNLESSVSNLSLPFSNLTTINYGGTQSKWLSDFGYSTLDEWKNNYGFNGDIHFGG